MSGARQIDGIVWHWTGGGNRANDSDRQHYHYVIEGDGTVVRGRFAPEDNLNTADGTYAAHTARFNTGKIGIALAGMRGAVERPFKSGPSPINRLQVDTLIRLSAELILKYPGIRVSRETTLSHAEVQPTLGIRQRNKWDFKWLPGMAVPGDPVAIGDGLRERLRAELARVSRGAQPPRNPPPPGAPKRIALFRAPPSGDAPRLPNAQVPPNPTPPAANGLWARLKSAIADRLRRR